MAETQKWVTLRTPALDDVYVPEDDDVFEECKEYEDDASAHPDVQRRYVTDFWSTLPEKRKIE
jgi:hypothetical protein